MATKSELWQLCSNLITEHFKKQDETVRSFKWIALIPQSGEGYENNKNVYALQDAAIKRLEQEKAEMLALLLKLTSN